MGWPLESFHRLPFQILSLIFQILSVSFPHLYLLSVTWLSYLAARLAPFKLLQSLPLPTPINLNFDYIPWKLV